jgi:hypothetical protein
LIGTIPFLAALPADKPFELYKRVREKYGDVVGLFFGLQPAIIVNGMECAKEVSSREDFAYRPKFTAAHHKMFDHQKIGMTTLNIKLKFNIF